MDKTGPDRTEDKTKWDNTCSVVSEGMKQMNDVSDLYEAIICIEIKAGF